MLSILLTVALNDLPPVQRQDPEGKNTNGLGKSILEQWKLTTPQSYYQVKTTPLKFGAIRTKIPNLISTLTTWPTNVGIQKDSKSSLQQSSKKSKTGLGGQTTSPPNWIPHENQHNLHQTWKLYRTTKTSRKIGQPNRPQRMRKRKKSGKRHQVKMGNY